MLNSGVKTILKYKTVTTKAQFQTASFSINLCLALVNFNVHKKLTCVCYVIFYKVCLTYGRISVKVKSQKVRKSDKLNE